MSVLHNPFYNAALSHFLEARRQHELVSGGGISFHNSSGSGSETGTESLSPSPPAINSPSQLLPSGTKSSFTIDAILGLGNGSGSQNCTQDRNLYNRHFNTVLDYSSNTTTRKRSLSSSSEKCEENVSNKSGIGKSKRVRTIFTPEQLERLEAEFERQQYMVGPERLYLAHTLQLTEAQVKVWFQNRRIKWRKQHLEMTQQRLALLKQHRQQRLLQHQQQQQQRHHFNNNQISENESDNSATNLEHQFNLI